MSRGGKFSWKSFGRTKNPAPGRKIVVDENVYDILIGKGPSREGYYEVYFRWAGITEAEEDRRQGVVPLGGQLNLVFPPSE